MSISRHRRVLLAAAVVLATRAMPAEAALITFHDITGVFDAPVGGVNSGVGTNSFSTGTPSAGSTANMITFLPEPSVVCDCSFEVPTGDVVVGRFQFVNGQTVAGTAATAVRWTLNATATLSGVVPPDRPANASFAIGFMLTENTTGNPVLDADFWEFPFIGVQVMINEDDMGEVAAIGRFVPENFGSPPQNFRFELTGLRVESGGITIVPMPEPSTLTLSVISFSGLAMRRWQARRRTRTGAR